MLIEPPSDNSPELLQEEIPIKSDWDECRCVALFLNCKSWLCECGLTNFGRNKQCAKWSCKKPRPTTWRPK